MQRQRLQTLPSRSRPVRAGLQVHLPEPEISLQAFPGPAPAPRPARGRLYAGRSADWVKEWLDAREKRAARQEQKQENKGQPADPAAAAKREASRLKRMAAGLDDLERWMCDLIRHGLGQLSGTPPGRRKPPRAWSTRSFPASPRGCGTCKASRPPGEDWPGVVLAQFGQLQLLIDAFRHLDALSPEEQADVRAALGLSPDKDEVLATGERLSDLWLVLGVGYAEENRLWRRRVWLRGQNNGRTALLLDFSHGGKHFEQSFVVGSLTDMTLAFYPGAVPLRAIATGDPVRAKTAPIPTVSLREALEGMAKAIAAQPWQGPPAPHVSDGVPCRSDDSWFLQTDAGDRLPLSTTTTTAGNCSRKAADAP